MRITHPVDTASIQQLSTLRKKPVGRESWARAAQGKPPSSCWTVACSFQPTIGLARRIKHQWQACLPPLVPHVVAVICSTHSRRKHCWLSRLGICDSVLNINVRHPSCNTSASIIFNHISDSVPSYPYIAYTISLGKNSTTVLS